MKRRVFLGLALVATLLGSAGPSNAEERKPLDASGPLAVAPEQAKQERAKQQPAKQQQVNGRVELLRELLAAQQARQTRRIAALAPHRGAATRGLPPDPYGGCKIRVVRPDPNVDYKIVVVRPDPNVDYKIRNAYPGGLRMYAVPRNDGRRTIIVEPNSSRPDR
jgi:hypothetical protein